jgi:hypothetical protein
MVKMIDVLKELVVVFLREKAADQKRVCAYRRIQQRVTNCD